MATVGTVHTVFLNLWSVVVYISSKSSMTIQGAFYSGTTENSGHGPDIFWGALYCWSMTHCFCDMTLGTSRVAEVGVLAETAKYPSMLARTRFSNSLYAK